MTHTICRLLPFLAILAFSTASHAQETVTVERDDSLSTIAQRVYGDGSQWQRLCEANTSILTEGCDALVVGSELVVPPLDGAAADPAPLAGAAADPAPSDESVLRFGPEVVDLLVVPEGFTVEEESETIRISGHVADAVSTGRTGGVSFQLPDSFEEQALGRTVRVTVTALLEDAGLVQLAYSTAEIGNSGWQDLEIGPGMTTASFDYTVADGTTEGGDFIGILPDPRSSGQTLEFQELTVELVD